MKKPLILIAMLILSLNVFAINYGNETRNIIVAPNSFKMFTHPQLNKQNFAEFQLLDSDGNALSNYHVELYYYDSRGVRMEEPREIKFSDSNGFISFNTFLIQCSPVQSENCFYSDENYSAVFIGKGLYRSEQFQTKLPKFENVFVGDTMRTIAINAEYVVVISIGFLFLLIVGTLLYKKVVLGGS